MKLKLTFDDTAYRKDCSHLAQRSGLYFIFGGDFNELLYIGWAALLNERLNNHFAGHSKNTSHFSKEMKIAKIIYAENFDSWREKILLCKGDKVRDIEFYMIERLQPKYNINKSDWR